jgi:catechol 2,3-dioxygenase-like lactoylglutathione lyase family enzyme
MKTSTTKSSLAVAVLLTSSLLLSAPSPSMAREGIVSFDTGEYGLSLVLMPDATTSSQEPDGGCIASGETKSGTIFPAGDIDSYTFYGQAGQGVVIEMADISGALYPRLQLFGPNGVLVAEDADSWIFHYRVVRIENYQLKKTGIYTIVASNCVGVVTGKYGLSLVMAPGATTSSQDPNGGDIVAGETKTGNISPAGDTDAYAFYGQPEQGVVIEMADVNSTGDLYPRLELYDPNGVRVAEAADSWIFHYRVVRIENYQLKKTGIYTIVASNCVGVVTGEYGLSLVMAPPNDPCGLYPYDPQPTDGNSVSLCGPNTLSWWSVKGATEYDVSFYVGPCMTPGLHLTMFITTLENAPQNITRIHVPMPALDANKVYYWQVVARTPAGDVQGPTWWFATKPCPFPSCSLTLSAIGRGSITDPNAGVHSYPCGQVVPVTAVADTNYEFVRWEGTAVDANKVVVDPRDKTGSKVSVTVDGVYTLRAVFEEVIYDFPLDSNPGWAMNGQWEFGKLTGPAQRGREYGKPDPTSGHTGQNVFGVNLNGDYNTAIGGPYTLVAGPFDLRGYKDVTLKFWRWLNVDWGDYVRSSVEISTDGKTWSLVWQNPQRAEVADSAWTPVEYDISAQADGQPAVYLRWSYQIVKERACPYSGWNLDDIQLIGCKK